MMPVDGGRGENSTRRIEPTDGLPGTTADDFDASPAAVPDVTALAQQMLDTLRVMEAQDFLALDREGQRSLIEILAALLALVERQREEIRLREELQIPVIPRGAQAKMERLEAELEQTRQERDDAWEEVERAEGDWLSEEKRADTAERERDDAISGLARSMERRHELERERDEAQAHARELAPQVERARKACNICGEEWPNHAKACAYPANVRRECALRETLSTIANWPEGDIAMPCVTLARAALVVAGRPPECGSIVDHIPDGFVCRLPRGHQGDHAYTEDPAAGRPPTDREQP